MVTERREGILYSENGPGSDLDNIYQIYQINLINLINQITICKEGK